MVVMMVVAAVELLPVGWPCMWDNSPDLDLLTDLSSTALVTLDVDRACPPIPSILNIEAMS